MSPRPHPELRVGDEFELRIDDLTRGGAGLGRLPDGRVVFVDFVAPGDRVRARVRRLHPRRVEAALVQVLEPSALRVAPRCEVFGRCGGCQWQHLPYDLQWRTKLRGVAEARERAGVRTGVVVDEFPAGEAWGYRNRVQLRGEGSAIGYLAAASHELVPIRSCPVARPEIEEALAAIRVQGMTRGKAYKVELEVLPDGSLRSHWDASHAAEGFRQVNDTGNVRLQEWLRERTEEFLPAGAGELWDLYGGAGNLSLPLAGRFASIHCVDPSAPRNRPRETPSQLHFHSQETLAWLRLRERTGVATGRPRVAFLDPPRQGFQAEGPEIARLLWKLEVRRVALVSCDPDAHGRDLAALGKVGYEIRRLAVVDLFPQTCHVEALAWLADTGGS